MLQKAFLYLFLLCPLSLSAQFIDDFSDGNFTHAPEWLGDTEKFVIENQVLRLYDNAAGSAFLVTQSTVIDNTQWEFWIRLAFTPSNNNHPRIYLMSDQADLSGPLNGYYIRIGKDGTENKRLYFYKQTGELHTEIMEGNANIANQNNNLIRIKVLRDHLGNWEFFADPTGGNYYNPQGSVSDIQHTSSQWFGIKCFYTVSNAANFYFDDVYVGDIIVDTIPPEVLHIEVITQNTLEITFSEAVEAITAQNVTYYFVNKGIGPPISAYRSDVSPNKVVLSFAQSFTPGEIYNITIAYVKDLSDNRMIVFMGDFYWYVPQKFDVVFNELMINPTPQVGLPAHEYIELYNTSNFDLNLQNWTLQHGNTQRILPHAIIPSQGYLVLTNTAAIDDLVSFENVVAVPGLSSTALTNSGTNLVLWNQDMEVISFVSYSDQWYANASKSSGGWSLEKIDPFNYCEGANNWRASTDMRGGTPGEPNSIMGHNPDITEPNLLRVGYEAPNHISLFFSESMDPHILIDVENYDLNEGLGKPKDAILFPPLNTRVDLLFDKPLADGVIYQLTASNNITDCAGNPLNKNKGLAGKPEKADSLDMVINEILFNPPDRGVRYIEIYNHSQKIIDLRNYILSSKDTIENVLTTIREISPESLLFFPGEYMVLTPDPENVKSQFMIHNPDVIFQTTLSSMTNARGIVVLASKGLKVIDLMIYEENMHYALLTDKKGVALERLNYSRPTLDHSNWHSAARNVGFGTPGFKNSQFTLNIDVVDENFELYPRIFSPDNDGVDDVLNIAYQLTVPGYTANINIYDSRGRHTKTLLRSELLATNGIFTWDGTTNDNQKANMGIYIIFIELFEPGGTVKTIKKTAVLGGRL